MSNERFAEYVTSGAFALTLSRRQISMLAMLPGGLTYAGPEVSALERRGLAECVPSPADWNQDAVEFRITAAGLLVLRLLSEAGLTNQGEDAVAEEMQAMRAELVERRREAADCRLRVESALARKDELRHELDMAKSRIAVLEQGVKHKIEIRLPIRDDPLPNRADDELRAP